MVDDRTDELIQMDIDGELSTAEKAELQAALAADDGARESVESYRRLARQLDALPRAEAPPSLAGNVMRALRGRRGGSQQVSAAPPYPQRRRNILWAAYAAAAGLILGLLAGPAVLRDAFRTPVDAGRASASIGLADVSSWNVVDRRSAVSPRGRRIDLTVRRSGSSLAVETSFAGEIGSEVAISWDPSRASLLAFARSDASGAPQLEEGRIRAPIGGDGTLTLVFEARRTPGPIHLDIDGTRMLSTDSPAGSTRE